MSKVCPSLDDDDRISNLPVELKHSILKLLPVDDAARTSTLSKSWRETWTIRPWLDLNKLFFSQVTSKKNEEAHLSAFSAAVDMILSVHTGPVFEIEIYIPPKLDNHHIHHWIEILSKEDVTVLEVDNSENDACLVPSYLFDFTKLKGLGLSKWILSPPPEFKCFSNLIAVHLMEVSISAPISFGTQLQDLDLNKCSGIENVVLTNIKNLRRLIIVQSSKIDWRWLENARNLELLVLVLTHADFNNSKSVNLIRLLSNSTKIQILFLHDLLLEILGPDPFTLKTRATKMVNLNILTLCFLSYNLRRISNTLCFIRNLPNLLKVRIILDFEVPSSNPENSTIERYLESQDWKDLVLDQLLIVHICGVVGLRSELQFAKIFLASCPSLKEMSLFCSTTVSDPNEKLRIQREFLQLPRKSQQAQLFWFD